MKVASVKKPSIVSVDEVEKPSLDQGDLLIKMHACGICGSDLEKVFGQYGKTSLKLGHEPAGEVIEVGPNVSDFKKGDRVFTHHHVPCNTCHLCKHGNETLCEKYSQSNLLPCGLSEEYVVPKWNVENGGVLNLPDSVSFEEAAMIEPLACCIRAWNKLTYQKGDSVAIFGIGPTGMMHVLLAHSKKFSKVFCFDVNDFRLEFAKKFNVTESLNSNKENIKQRILEHTDGRGVDIAIIATSSIKAIEDSIDIVRNGGTVMVFGVPSKGAMMNIDMSNVYSKEITIVSSYAAADNDTKKALEMIHSKSIDVKPLITHKYSILDSQKAFEHARRGDDAMKIIITR